ncbi:MAG: GNAT family N-acetyltransferase [Candidatus Hydrogenedentes bacterium]|nr:GNAT family N-acetyltransferase [Candidatus Hydrogenedentota bacterium]
MKPRDDVTLRLLDPAETPPTALLLLGDESETMIGKYVSNADILIAENGSVIIGVCAIAENTPTTGEIKNIAVAEDHQGRGIGMQLLQHAIMLARQKGYVTLEIATGNSGIGQLYLYQKAGFEMTGIDRNYFVENYPIPIVENGIPCKHRVRLKMDLVP